MNETLSCVKKGLSWTTAMGVVAVLGMAVLSPVAAAADAWPTKPIRLVVGYPSGSSPDHRCWRGAGLMRSGAR